MNQKEMIKEISARTELTQVTINKVLEAMEDIVVEQVRSGDEVKVFPGVVFRGEVKPAGVARNPRTGEEVKTPEKMVCKVHMTGSFKNKIANEDEE